MEKQKVDKLTDLLRRLNTGESTLAVREEAKEFLATVNPADLSLAEQQLIEAGLAPEDLRHLCAAHMEMMGGQLEQMKAQLAPGHVIHTLICEHEQILCFLDELDSLNQAIQRTAAGPLAQEQRDHLLHIAGDLVGAEPHHQREEDILFPELERRGVSGPPQIMRMEHEELRRRKRELLELAQAGASADFSAFKKKLDVASKFIVLTLRDHIFKENNILYPTALQVVRDDAIWAQMKEGCDRIGYCCFTPA